MKSSPQPSQRTAYAVQLLIQQQWVRTQAWVGSHVVVPPATIAAHVDARDGELCSSSVVDRSRQLDRSPIAIVKLRLSRLLSTSLPGCVSMVPLVKQEKPARGRSTRRSRTLIQMRLVPPQNAAPNCTQPHPNASGNGIASIPATWKFPPGSPGASLPAAARRHSSRVRVHPKHLVPFAQQIDQVPPAAASRVHQPHPRRNVPAQNLVEQIYVICPNCS